MKKFENPIQFDIKKKINDVEVVYTDLMEVSQGGPEIGTILIGGEPVTSYRFGGPCLHKGDYIYAPAYIKKLLKAGFRLSRINMKNRKVKLLGELKDLIFLDKIEGNRIYYYEDLDKTTHQFHKL